MKGEKCNVKNAVTKRKLQFIVLIIVQRAGVSCVQIVWLTVAVA